jgi:hypothetical protein
LVVPVVPVVAGVLAFVVAPEAGVLATTVLGAVVVPFKQLVLPELYMRNLIYQIKHYIPV